MRCDDVSILLSESAELNASLPRAITRHTEHCLRCQAEAAQFRKIRRTMISMRGSYVDPGMGLVSDVMNLVRDEGSDGATALAISSSVSALGADRQHADRRRAAYVAAAAATAAGAAGALVLAARSKRPAS